MESEYQVEYGAKGEQTIKMTCGECGLVDTFDFEEGDVEIHPLNCNWKITLEELVCPGCDFLMSSQGT